MGLSDKKTTALVSLSGGMDSATVLAKAISIDTDVRLAVGFTYGSKHNQYENEAAEKIAVHYDVPYRLIDLSPIMGQFRSDLMLSGGDIPEGHYEHKSMSKTVVPGRNTIFNAILMGLAESESIDQIWIGIHAGDHAIYPDCRPLYYQDMRNVILRASGKILYAPFLNSDKAKILSTGHSLSVPYKLTRTCYKDQPTACGKCGSCQERLEAFKKIGFEDPIEYESREILPKE